MIARDVDDSPVPHPNDLLPPFVVLGVEQVVDGPEELLIIEMVAVLPTPLLFRGYRKIHLREEWMKMKPRGGRHTYLGNDPRDNARGKSRHPDDARVARTTLVIPITLKCCVGAHEERLCRLGRC